MAEKLGIPREVENAKWIWTDDDPAESDVWVYARKQFNVENPDGAKLSITADTRYCVWVNGKQLGFGPPKSHVETPTLDTYPIADLLLRGENQITVLVYSFGEEGYICALMPVRGALLASIGVDGKLIATDSSWKVHREYAYCQTGVRLNENQPYMEQFDARVKMSDHWDQWDSDDPWQPATELSGPIYPPWTSIESRDIPLFNWKTRPPDSLLEWGISEYDSPVVEIATSSISREIGQARHLPPNSDSLTIALGLGGKPDAVTLDATGLSETQGCYVVYDFGRVWTGYPVIVLRGASGTIVDLSYAEGLVRGRVDPSKQTLVYTDRIILGDKPLIHRIMLPKCLRYMQVDVRRGKTQLESVALGVSTYPVQRHGLFHCSDPVLDQAWEISAHTLQLCMEDSYMDTPWRERGAWLGDVVPEVHANYYSFGDAALIRRFLKQHARGQKPDGSLNGKYPGKASSDLSTWNLTYAFVLIDYVRHTGDTKLAEDLWPTVHSITRWLDGYLREDGLYGDFPLKVTPTDNIYTFIDWAPVNTAGANAAFNAFAHMFWQACAELAEFATQSRSTDSATPIILSLSKDGSTPQDTEECTLRQAQCDGSGTLRQAQCDDVALACRTKADRLRDNFRKMFWDKDKRVFVNGVNDGKRLARYGVHENVLSILAGIASDNQKRDILASFDDEVLSSIFTVNPDVCDVHWCVDIALNKYPWDDTKPVPVGTAYFSYWLLQSLCEMGKVDLALEFIRKHWGEWSRKGATTVWEEWTGEGSLSHAWSSSPIVVFGKYVLGASPTNDPAHWQVFPDRGGLDWAYGRVPTPSGTLAVSWKWDGGWQAELSIPTGLTVAFGLPESEIAGLEVDGQPAQSQFRSGNRLCVKLGEGRHEIRTSLPSR